MAMKLVIEVYYRDDIMGNDSEALEWEAEKEEININEFFAIIKDVALEIGFDETTINNYFINKAGSFKQN